MKKKFLIVVAALVILVVTFILLVKFDVVSFDSFLSRNKTVTESSSVESLTKGYYYIWHNPNSNNINDDLENPGEDIVFNLCPAGVPNWDKHTFVDHILWFNTEDDVTIPTLYPGDKLLYLSDTTIPYKGISWERFKDFGYTIGVGNFIGDESGHYHITSENGDNFKGYVCMDSDASELNQFADISDLFLDKVGGVPIRKNSISDGGTVINLDKDQQYLCEWYTGSFFQDFEMSANVHPFCGFETFTTYDYEFLHSNVVEIKIPEWFKSGYYYINNVGLFRLVLGNDSKIYNGESYDSNINWNDPIILYDDEHNILYDPSTGFDKRNSSSGSQIYNGTNSLNNYYESDPNASDPGNNEPLPGVRLNSGGFN